MRLLLLLSAFIVASDISRVYASGLEPAKGGQDLARAYGNGKELATNANGSLSVIEVSGKEKSK